MNVQNISNSQDCLHKAWWKQLEEMITHTCTKMHSVCTYEQNVQNRSKGELYKEYLLVAVTD